MDREEFKRLTKEEMGRRIREGVKAVIEQVLEEEMTEHLAAGYRERTPSRRGEWNGYYTRDLIGLEETASSLGLELEVVARPYAGVRGVWVQEGAEVPEIPRERGFKPLPKRWVVERTFAWLGRNRRLAKDYEENPRVSEAWVYLGMLRLLVKRLAKAA
jgi:hypothetical protein